MARASFPHQRALHNPLDPRLINRMSEKDTAAQRPGAEPVPGHKPKGPPREIRGPKGPEPTRDVDWERNGRCTDF